MLTIIAELNNKPMALSILNAIPAGKIVAKGVFHVDAASAQDASSPVTSNVIAFFRDNLYMLTHAQREGVENWKKLFQVFGKNISVFVPILEDVLMESEPAELMDWQRVMRNNSFPAMEKLIGERIEDITSKLRIPTVGIDPLVLEKSTKAFNVERKASAYQTLTNVQLSSQACSQIIMNLGVAYDVFKMIETKSLEAEVTGLSVHNRLIATLQAWGMAEIGIPSRNQQHLDNGNKPKWSKAAILKIIQSPTPPQPKAKKGSVQVLGGGRQLIVLMTAIHGIGEDYKGVLPPCGDISELTASILASTASKTEVKPSTWTKLTNLVTAFFLTKNEYNNASNSLEKLTRVREQSKWALDEWQSNMIGYIMKGESVLVNGPTSGGKTFASMAALDYLLNVKDGIKMAYIAPTFHLALQIYANIKLTFPNRVCSLITSVSNSVVPNTQVWIGTPSEMWAYLTATGETFDIGIFDEFHAISTTFGTGKLATLRSEALANLLGKCTQQVIALSATINEEDIPILCTYISTRTGIRDIKTVVYTERIVSLQKYVWNGDDYIPLATLRQQAGGAEVVLPVSPVTPQATFNMTRKLESKDQLPALFFDGSEKQCFDNYSAYVEWIQMTEEPACAPVWYRVKESISHVIESYNDDSEEWYAKYQDAYSSKSPEALKEVLPRFREYSNIRAQVIDKVKKCLSENIFPLLHVAGKYMVHLPFNLVQHANYIERTNRRGTVKQIPLSVSSECRDLLFQFENYASMQDPSNDSDPQLIGPLPAVCDSVAPFFRIGGRVPEMDNLQLMFNPGKSAANWKIRKQMLLLCEAESIREAEVEPLFRLISRGLEYGVGIILPTMPFVVQYEMIRMLAKKHLRCVFASHSMAMGINYPIRTVVIRSTTEQDLNVCEFMQMEGRCGRRRLDNQGHVITWNISNAATASLETLPRIALPAHGPDRGSLILNPKHVALQVDMARLSMSGYDSLAGVIGILSAGVSGVDDFHVKDIGGASDDDRRRTPADEAGPSAKKVSTISAASFDEMGMISAITACITPIAEAIGLDLMEVAGITERIHHIVLGRITQEMREDPYAWAQKINDVKAALQELHTKFHRCSNTPWLAFIVNVFEILHRVQYRQMRL